MDLIERLIYWLEVNESECVERDLINDSLEEIERLRARLAVAENDAAMLRITLAGLIADHAGGDDE